MSTSAAVRVGSIWKRGEREVVVVAIDPERVATRAIVDGQLGASGSIGRRTGRSAHDGEPRGYTFVAQQPTLRCISVRAAEEAVAFLRSKGIGETSAFACGDVVVVSMTPPSVLRLAEDAFDRGWADDEQCARMIGDLG